MKLKEGHSFIDGLSIIITTEDACLSLCLGFRGFFSIIMLITQAYKTKNITITRYYCIFPVPEKKGKKNKLKQSEIKVKKIIRMKKQFMVKFINSFYGQY